MESKRILSKSPGTPEQNPVQLINNQKINNRFTSWIKTLTCKERYQKLTCKGSYQFVSKHRAKGLNIAMFRSKTSSNNIVWSRHTLNTVAGDVSMWLVRIQIQSLSGIKLDVVKEEGWDQIGRASRRSPDLSRFKIDFQCAVCQSWGDRFRKSGNNISGGNIGS